MVEITYDLVCLKIVLRMVHCGRCSSIEFFKNSGIPWQYYYYLKVTDASSGRDACSGQGLNGVDCGATAAAVHGYGCYCCYCFVGHFGVVSFSCFSCDDFGTRS